MHNLAIIKLDKDLPECTSWTINQYIFKVSSGNPRPNDPNDESEQLRSMTMYKSLLDAALAGDIRTFSHKNHVTSDSVAYTLRMTQQVLSNIP